MTPVLLQTTPSTLENILQRVTDKEEPINNIVFTTPTVTIWSDAYKYGIGVYNDKAWNGSGTYPEMA